MEHFRDILLHADVIIGDIDYDTSMDDSNVKYDIEHDLDENS